MKRAVLSEMEEPTSNEIIKKNDACMQASKT